MIQLTVAPAAFLAAPQLLLHPQILELLHAATADAALDSVAQRVIPMVLMADVALNILFVDRLRSTVSLQMAVKMDVQMGPQEEGRNQAQLLSQ
jgi:hypothetical protein